MEAAVRREESSTIVFLLHKPTDQGQEVRVSFLVAFLITTTSSLSDGRGGEGIGAESPPAINTNGPTMLLA